MKIQIQKVWKWGTDRETEVPEQLMVEETREREGEREILQGLCDCLHHVHKQYWNNKTLNWTVPPKIPIWTMTLIQNDKEIDVSPSQIPLRIR